MPQKWDEGGLTNTELHTILHLLTVPMSGYLRHKCLISESAILEFLMPGSRTPDFQMLVYPIREYPMLEHRGSVMLPQRMTNGHGSATETDVALIQTTVVAVSPLP